MSKKETIKIIYTGKQWESLEKEFKEMLTNKGYSFIGSGYNVKTGERDLEFEFINPSSDK